VDGEEPISDPDVDERNFYPEAALNGLSSLRGGDHWPLAAHCLSPYAFRHLVPQLPRCYPHFV